MIGSVYCTADLPMMSKLDQNGSEVVIAYVNQGRGLNIEFVEMLFIQTLKKYFTDVFYSNLMMMSGL